MPAIRPHRAPAGRATPPHPFTSVARATSAGVTALAGPRCHSTPSMNGARQLSMNGARQPSTNGATHATTNEHWSCTNAAIPTPCQVSSGTVLSAAHPPVPRRDVLPDGPPSWVIGTGVLCAFASLRLCVQKRAPAVVASRRTSHANGRSRGQTRHGRRNPPATAAPLPHVGRLAPHGC